jgi:hypothetical protein
MSNITKSQHTDLLAVFDAEKPNLSIIQFQRKLTITDAIQTQNYFYKHENKQTEQQVLKIIKELIVNIQEILILNSKLSDIQTDETAMLIFEKHRETLTIEELVLVFKQVKMGVYGKVFNSINITTIFDWIDKYLQSDERANFWERKNRQPVNTIENVIASIPTEIVKEINNSITGHAARKPFTISDSKTRAYSIKGLEMRDIVSKNKKRLSND